MKYLPYIVIIVLMGLLFLQRECTPPCPECPETVTTITIHDTIHDLDTVYAPRWVFKDTGSTIYKYMVVDTAAILKDYFTAYFYSDTLLNDTNGIITLSDSVTQNRIVYRKPLITLYPHTVINTITEKVKLRNKVFIGFGVNGWADKFGVSANMALITKRDNLYTVGYDPINKRVNLSMYWKLRFKR